MRLVNRCRLVSCQVCQVLKYFHWSTILGHFAYFTDEMNIFERATNLLSQLAMHYGFAFMACKELSGIEHIVGKKDWRVNDYFWKKFKKIIIFRRYSPRSHTASITLIHTSISHVLKCPKRFRSGASQWKSMLATIWRCQRFFQKKFDTNFQQIDSRNGTRSCPCATETSSYHSEPSPRRPICRTTTSDIILLSIKVIDSERTSSPYSRNFPTRPSSGSTKILRKASFKASTIWCWRSGCRRFHC